MLVAAVLTGVGPAVIFSGGSGFGVYLFSIVVVVLLPPV